jgi:hypothetical protein
MERNTQNAAMARWYRVGIRQQLPLPRIGPQFRLALHLLNHIFAGLGL